MKKHIVLLFNSCCYNCLINLMPKGGADLLSSYETIAGAKKEGKLYMCLPSWTKHSL
jgi:hypothetical protein